MKKIWILVFVCLIVSIAFADNAMIKTFFKQDDIAAGRPRQAEPMFAECVPVSDEFLQCPKNRALILAQQNGRQQLFYTKTPPPAPTDRYIYAGVAGNCRRIIRELATQQNAFYGTEVCL